MRRRFEPDELDDVAVGLLNPLTKGVFELLATIFACPFGSRVRELPVSGVSFMYDFRLLWRSVGGGGDGGRGIERGSREVHRANSAFFCFSLFKYVRGVSGTSSETRAEEGGGRGFAVMGGGGDDKGDGCGDSCGRVRSFG